MVTVFTIVGAFAFFLIIGVCISLMYTLVSPNQTTISMENKTKALDVFVYLGIFITLVISVTNILQIMFAAINRKFIDVLDFQNSADVYNSDVRFAIASLVVMYPIYIGLSWFTSRDIMKFLYKRDLKIRKMIIYSALFITLCTLVGTLVSSIYTYLGGELTARFSLKAVSVFVVAFLVFGYYLYSLRRDYSLKTYIPHIFIFGVSFLVIVSLLWSILIIGTPAEMRSKRIDGTRLSDISRLQQEVFNHFQSTDVLPVKLYDLNDAFQGYAVPTDPVTKTEYKYTVLQQPVVKMNYSTNRKEQVTSAIFELCATFETVRAINARGMQTSEPIGLGGNAYSASNYYFEGDQSSFWNHGVGESCFKRIITPEMYYGGK